ncbi:hypothetical protein Ssi02_55140 [Sinosporangium siamense]|uniref:Low molecular weight protein antigen 6 PH domain-containing protein n=1 Tax=Sinosporangium siamense TaxID=1367973 RepID=A0A919V9B8_9ACTN|nr:hypothetical protein Ssi02_55140 [Sinosporangium siamense]
MTVAKAVGALVCLALAVFFALDQDTRGVVLAAPATVLLAVLAARDLIVPVRLAPDDDGLTMVVGFAGRHHVPWSEVTDIRVDVRRRLTSRTELLEVHTEEGLQVFSSYDLGVPCKEALAVLREKWHQARRRGTC